MITFTHLLQWISYPFKKLFQLLFPNFLSLGKKNAQFMGFFEKRRLLKGSHTGLVLNGGRGRLSENDSFRNLTMVASTWWWKTSGYIIPNILHQNTGSMVITDPSGWIFEKTAWHLQKKGYQVRVLNPLKVTESIAFNPLSGLTSYRDIDEIAHILVKTANPDSKDPFWTQGAESIISILARTLLRHPEKEKYWNLANVLHLLNNFEDWTPLNGFISDYADPQTFSQYKGFISNAPNTLQGILSNARVSLKAIADPDIAQLTASSSFDFASLRQQKTALFLVFPQNRLSYYSFLMNLFYTRLFHYCLDDSQYTAKSLPIYFFLDEFWHLNIPDFGSIITTTRQRRISISIILQSLSQLEARYWRHDAHTILNGGVASRIFSPWLDTQTNQMLSQTLWTHRHEISTSEDHLQIKDDPILEAYQIRTMKDREALFLFANKKPIKLSITRFFESFVMWRLVDLQKTMNDTHSHTPLEMFRIGGDGDFMN